MTTSRLFKVTQASTGPRSVRYTVRPTWRVGAITWVLRALTRMVQIAGWAIERLESWPAR